MDSATESDPPAGAESVPPSAPPGGRRRPRWQRTLLGAVLFMLTVLAGITVVFVAGRVFRPHTYHGTAFPSASPAAPLDGLFYDDGTAADLGDFSDEVVLIYFGYTYCPDVCPTTLSVAAEAIESMGGRGEDVQLLMVSVDPARDPLEDLGVFVRHFHPGFRGVGGSPDAIADVAALYGIFYQLQEPGDDGNYVVDHTATLVGIDPEGNLKVLWDPSVTPDDLEADLRELLR